MISHLASDLLTFLREFGLTLLYGAPIALACCYASYHLVKRLRAGGWWALTIGFAVLVTGIILFDWQTRSLNGGHAVTGGVSVFSIFVVGLADAVSTRPVFFKKREQTPRAAEQEPEQMAGQREQSRDAQALLPTTAENRAAQQTQRHVEPGAPR